MPAFLPGLIAFVVFVVLGVCAWIWWAGPRYQVPPHLDEKELRRLEVQDRLRQTNYQIFTAIGLGATFLATVFQFSATTRQWSSDFEFRTAQERITRYADAVKAMDPEKGSALSNISSVTTLSLLAMQDPPRFHQQVTEVLSQAIVSAQKSNVMNKPKECLIATKENPSTQTAAQQDRSEAPPLLLAAMQAIGHPQFAAERLNYSTDACNLRRTSIDRSRLTLEHMTLDNLNLAGRDFSCAQLSQSRFHLTSFIGADLRGADLRGTRAGDWETPSYPGDHIVANRLYLGEEKKGLPEWQRFRCWTADFRFAKLNKANFEGANLAGADFRNADMAGVNLCRADISRANFIGAKGLTEDMLHDACVGSAVDIENERVNETLEFVPLAQPLVDETFGKTFRVSRCRGDKICKPFP